VGSLPPGKPPPAGHRSGARSARRRRCAGDTLTFAPGEPAKAITIEVKGDSKKEANETFSLDLFGLSSKLFTRNRGFGTIFNDD
jgi:hypothetical protein